VSGAVAERPRGYLLGGETRRRSLFGGGLTTRQWAVLAAAVGVGLVLLVITQSIWVLFALALSAVAAVGLARRRTLHGDSWAGGLAETGRAWVERRAGRHAYTPGGMPAGQPLLPRELGVVRALGYTPPDSAATLALVQHADPRRGWAEGYVSATLEIIGYGDGLREVRETNADGARFGRFLYALARPDFPVAQVDVATRVLPVSPAAYRQYLLDQVRADTPPQLAASMHELAEFAAHNAEAYRTFLTVRMPVPALAARADGRGSTEAIAAAAYDTVAAVARQAQLAGFGVRAGLGPRRLGALIRHTWNPSYDLDDQDGVEALTDGWQPYVNRRGHVQAGQWAHAVASVPRDAWPMTEVGVRWLARLVTDVAPATIRTVLAQHRLVPKATAREQARIALTLDEAERLGRDKRGKVSTGVEEAQASAAARVLHDLLHEQAAGDRPALWVLVSSGSPAELRLARERIEDAAADAHIARLRWHDRHHHHAMQTVLPLARGIG